MPTKISLNLLYIVYSVEEEATRVSLEGSMQCRPCGFEPPRAPGAVGSSKGWWEKVPQVFEGVLCSLAEERLCILCVLVHLLEDVVVMALGT